MAYLVLADILSLVKGFEQIQDHLLTHTYSIILDCCYNRPFIETLVIEDIVNLCRNYHCSFALKLDSVRQDIKQNLLESPFVKFESFLHPISGVFALYLEWSFM